MSNLNVTLCYIVDEDCLGAVIQSGAHFSVVKYQRDGIEFEESFANDDLIFYDQINIEYEEE
jgi:hypothetical protein